MTPNISAPFRNVLCETGPQRVARVVAIGRDNLLDWWATMKHATFGASFGDSGCSFASSVAFMLDNGGPTEWQRANPDLFGDTIAAWDQLAK